MNALVDRVDALVVALEARHERERPLPVSHVRRIAVFVIAEVLVVGHIRRTVVLPVRRLREATAAVEEGRHDVLAAVSAGDEIGSLGERFNSMAVPRQGLVEQLRGCGRIAHGECLCGLAAATGEPVESRSSVEDRRHTVRYSFAEDHGHLVLPLVAGGRTLGVLCLYLDTGTELSERKRRLYRALSEIVAVSLQNALSHRTVAMLARSLESSRDSVLITEMTGKIILDNATAVIFLKDREGRYLLVNHQWESIFGVTDEEARGKTVHDMFPDTVADALVVDDRAVFASGARNC